MCASVSHTVFSDNSCFGFCLRRLVWQNLGMNPWGQVWGPKSPRNTVRSTYLPSSPPLHQPRTSLSLTPFPTMHQLLKQMVLSSQMYPSCFPFKHVLFFLLSSFYSGPSLPPLNRHQSFLIDVTASGLCSPPSCTQSYFSK